MLNLDGEEKLYLKNILDNYKDKFSHTDNKPKKYDDDFKKINKSIMEIEKQKVELVKEMNLLQQKSENYNKKLFGSMEDYRNITEDERVTDFDQKLLEFNKNIIKSEDVSLELLKKERNDLQKEKENSLLKKNSQKIDSYQQFSLTTDDIVEYEEKIIKCINNHKNILVSITLIDLSDNKIINNIKEYILGKDSLSIKLKIHSNMLFINNEKKYIEHFEPHGVDALYDTNEVFNILNKMHSNMPEFKNYKFYKQVETCPIIQGAQTLDKSYYCYIHSSYYALLRILYPNTSSEELQMMLISQKNDGYENEEKQNITSLDYLNKKYTRLSGEKIKARLENFMKWHSYIVYSNIITMPSLF